MFQLPIPIFDAEHSKGSAELGQLPDWNLNDLYTSTDAKELVNDLNWLEKECDEFAKNYEGKLKFLSADEMLKCVVRNEKISSISGRIISYAGLLYYQKTTDADRAKFLSDMQEKITIFTTKLVFFSLEINSLDDDFLESLLKENVKLSRYKPVFEKIRALKPYQLSDEIEKFLHDLGIVGDAWMGLKKPERIEKMDEVQGFLTNKDRFVDREEGGTIAFESGQTGVLKKTLYSEDLY